MSVVTPPGGINHVAERSNHSAPSPGAAAGSRSARGALILRLLFGVTWAIDAVLKWLPGYRHSFLSQLQGAAQGQPSWLHWWFHGWISVQSHAPALFADLTGVAETSLALVLVFGRRASRRLPGRHRLLAARVGSR